MGGGYMVVVLWPEYVDLEDGDVAVHVELHGRGWRVLSSARTAHRKLRERLEALGPSSFRKTMVFERRLGRVERHVRLGEEPPRLRPVRRRGSSFSVQAAARVRGTLYVDAISSSSSSSSKNKIVENLTEWLRGLGMPRHDIDEPPRQKDTRVDDLVATLIGTAAEDVAVGALAKTFRSAAREEEEEPALDRDDAALLVGSKEDVLLVDFGIRAYETFKSRALAAAAPPQRVVAKRDPSTALLASVASVVRDENLDLYEIFFFDEENRRTPRRRRSKVMMMMMPEDDDDTRRISYRELRRGLARLVSCLPVTDHTQYHH